MEEFNEHGQEDLNAGINNANGYELIDVNEDDLSYDEKMRIRIESDDPSLIKLEIRDDGYLSHDGDWERDGASIGRNTKLIEVTLGFSGEEVAKEDLEKFFRGLAANRSIKTLTFFFDLFDGEIFIILIQFFKNNKSFESLVIEESEMEPECPHKIASALGQFDSLKEFTLSDGHRHYDSNSARTLILSLAGHSSLRKLDLRGIQIGRNGCTALSSLLQKPNSNLAVLDLVGSIEDDEAATILATGLAENSALKDLNLSGNRNISQQGWQDIFAVLRSPSCRFEKLDLNFNIINHVAAASLSTALVSSNTLEALSLRRMRVNTNATWRAMFQFLQSPNSALEELDLSSNILFRDDIMNSLTNSLVNNSKLRKLNLSSNRDITAAGWQAFSPVLQSPHSALESLDLCGVSINDDEFDHLATSLARNNKLKELKFNYNQSVSAAGWEGLSTILRNPNSALEKINLQGNRINDRTMITLANSLVNNNNLRELDLGYYNSSVSSNGWGAFLPVLCNKSSIMATYRSNHTLEKLCDDDVEDELPEDVRSLLRLKDELPEDVRSLLRLNRENGRSQAARLKLIETHFSGSDIDMQPFIDMELNVLPSAVAWMGRDGIGEEGTWGDGFDLMYQFSRAMLSTLLD